MRSLLAAIYCWKWGHKLPDYDIEHVVGFCRRCDQPVR